MISTVHSRLAAFSLYSDSPAIKRTSDDAIVAMLAPHAARELVDRLEIGIPLEHALRAVRLADIERGMRSLT